MNILSNTNLLNSLLEQANSLPDVENLDEEISAQSELISEQDAKIAELAEVLAGKAGGSNNDILFAYISHSAINDQSYLIPFEQGMTWSDFIESRYNICYAIGGMSTKEFKRLQINSDNHVEWVGHRYLVVFLNGIVSPDSLIIENGKYMLYDND